MDAPPGLPGGSFHLADNPDVKAEWLPLEEVRLRNVYPSAACALLNVPPGEVRHLVNWN